MGRARRGLCHRLILGPPGVIAERGTSSRGARPTGRADVRVRWAGRGAGPAPASGVPGLLEDAGNVGYAPIDLFAGKWLRARAIKPNLMDRAVTAGTQGAE